MNKLKRVYQWFHKLPKQIQDSILFSASVIGGISTLLTVLGVSLKDLNLNIGIRMGTIFIFAIVLAWLFYLFVGNMFKDSVGLSVAKTPVEISCGDIFKTPGYKVIGCDTHFDTRVDDVVISKNSLHGKLLLEHANVDDVKIKIEESAKKLGLIKNKDGLYDFPLGTIVKYDSRIDNQTYLMLALTELNKNYESHTNMAKYELMLMKMWKEIDRVYASNDVVLPILGAGISRFDDGPKDKNDLLRCMLCTFNSSGTSLNSKIKIVLYRSADDFPLYEYKDILNVISRR